MSNNDSREQLVAASRAPESKQIRKKPEASAQKGHPADPGWRVRGIDLHDFHPDALTSQQAGKLQSLIGHAA